MAENNVRTLKVRLFTTKVIKSHVKLEVKSNATKIPRESTPYITLFSSSSTIENFSACCNTSRGIKLAAPQSRPSSLGLLVGKNKHENTYFSKQNQKKSKDNDSYHDLYETTITAQGRIQDFFKEGVVILRIQGKLSKAKELGRRKDGNGAGLG